VLLIVGAGVCSAFQIGKVPPALTELRGSLDLSLIAAGWVISIYNAMGAAGGVVLGAAGDWFGYKRAVLFGIVCIGLASLLGSVAPTAGLLLTSRLLEGLGYIVATVSAPALLFRLTWPADRGLAFGLWSCFMPFGTSAMMLGAPFLLEHVGWRGTWACNGLLVLLYAAVFHFALRGVQRPADFQAARPAELLHNVRLVASKPGPLLLAVTWTVYTVTFIVLVGFLPTLLMARGYSRPVGAALTAFVVAVNMAGALSGGWMIKRGAPRWALMAAATSVAGVAMLGIYAPRTPEWGRYALCVLFSLVGGLQPVSVLGGAPLYAPSPKLVATTNGFMNQCAYVGMMIGPPAAAALAAASGGWHNTPWLLTPACAVGLACALILRKIPPTNEL
jgi:MFS family permease